MKRAFSGLAKSYVKSEGGKCFFAADSGYSSSVYRVAKQIVATGCSIGFCYTANDSGYELKDALTVKLQGAEVFFPGTGELFELGLPPCSEHIVLFKQVEATYAFGWSSETTARRRQGAEMVEEAKCKVKTRINTNVDFQLYNEFDGCCFFFTNRGSQSSELVVTFDKQKTKNLTLEGSKGTSHIDFFEVAIKP